jgi:hypothetical protein
VGRRWGVLLSSLLRSGRWNEDVCVRCTQTVHEPKLTHTSEPGDQLVMISKFTGADVF